MSSLHRQAILDSPRSHDAVLRRRIIHLVPGACEDKRVPAACGKKPTLRSMGWTGPEITWPEFDGPGEVDRKKCRKLWHDGIIMFDMEPA